MPYDIIIGRTEKEQKELGSKGLIFYGKSYVKMGPTSSLSNNILIDVAKSHTILISGKKGSGKCLAEDSLITLENGSVKAIKELANDNNKILSLNDKLKICTSDKTEFFEREVDTLFQIKLRSGKEIKLTPEHPLLTIKGWKPAYDLGLGSRIATPRNLEVFGDDEMLEYEIKLLAYLLAEGHTKKIVLFANSDNEIVEEFRNSLKKFDSSLELIKEKESHYRISSPNWKTKVLKHSLLRNNMGQFIKGMSNLVEKRSIRKLIERESLFGLLSTQKFISENIFKLKKELLALFLNRLFSCDGSIYKDKKGNSLYWEISYGSSSKKLIHQVQHLLLRFNILSKLRKKKVKLKNKIFDAYEIVINEATIPKFIEQIGFFGEKRKKQEICLNELNNSNKIRNPNIDTIPKEIWDIYKPDNWAQIGRYFNYKHPKAMRERLFHSCSRQTLLKIAESEQSNPLTLLATSDIFWDEIVSMEKLEGNFKVYDICVPKFHNFVANDILVHNSYSIGVFAEEIANLQEDVNKNIAVLIFD
ncbi:MAG: LAGLIDADG family homing endonuclease, partial [Nanoarchaeota archaeon]